VLLFAVYFITLRYNYGVHYALIWLLIIVTVLWLADRYMYCEKCFNELPEDGIDMADDPLNPGL